MNQEKRILVASAIERLVENIDNSFEQASIIVEAFKGLKITGSSASISIPKSGDSAEGLTEHGNVSFDQGEKPSTHEFGIYKERVGKWVITKEISKGIFVFWKKHNLIWIRHFLHQNTLTESRRRYFLEYDDAFRPVAFGYIGEPVISFSVWRISIYFAPPIVLLGETKLPKEGPIFLYENPDL